MGNNAIVGQSGGPTSVINASLAGVFQACVMRGANRVYGMLNGVEGLLNERVADLTATLGSSLEIELLKRTPSSYLGSCRYKLPESSQMEAVSAATSASWACPKPLTTTSCTPITRPAMARRRNTSAW